MRRKLSIHLLLCFIAFMSCNEQPKQTIDYSRTPEQVVKDSITIANYNLSQDSIDKAELLEYYKTKSGRINKKHPEWSRDDCELLANRKVWVGMTLQMVVYLRGRPNTKNTSNYGNGSEYQYCWDDYDPSCFYCREDGIIYAYN